MLLDIAKIKQNLKVLNKKFDKSVKCAHKEGRTFSETDVRSGYLDKLLGYFGWDTSDITQVVQENNFKKETEKNRLKEIHSTYKKPDYELVDNDVPMCFFDTKRIDVHFYRDENHNVNKDTKEAKDVAFQLRSYGWSARLKYAIATDFKHFAIYNTEYEPDYNEPIMWYTKFFTIEDLIKNIKVYLPFFAKPSVFGTHPNLSSLGLNIPKDQDIKKYKPLDQSFLDLIQKQRCILGQNIFDRNRQLFKNNKYNNEYLNRLVQIIINQLIFIRFLESNNIEPINELQELFNRNRSDNFWKAFIKVINNRFNYKYDGLMFSCVKLFNSINLHIDNDAFSPFIKAFYGHTPYRFDVIKPDLIAEIYELFLGKSLVIHNGNIKLIRKSDRRNGSISTPYVLANYIVNTSMAPIYKLVKSNEFTINDMKHLKILDPNAGSGTFLLSVFNFLAKLKLKLLNRNTDSDQKALTFKEMKNIISENMFGVDIDPIALEVLKMSISLKLLLSNYYYPDFPDFKDALRGLSNNFKRGNTIVKLDSLSKITQLINVKKVYPTNYAQLYPSIMRHGGFNYIFSNPPYIESKYYIKNFGKSLYKYLKNEYSLRTGKVDLSLFFLKRYFELLKHNGHLGVIIQRRFFKAHYGKNIRNWLANNGYLYKINIFTSTKIFRHHITYVTSLFASKRYNNKVLINNDNYDNYGKHSSYESFIHVPQKNLCNRIWSYSSLLSSNYINKLLNRSDRKFYIINDKKSNFKISVGLQLLDKKYYFLKPFKGNVYKNRLGEKARLESNILKPFICNKHMYSFEKFNDVHSYALFPYNKSNLLLSNKYLKSKYPNAWKYLKYFKSHSKVYKLSGNNWYGYTRKQGFIGYKDKILVPMTAKAVTASYWSKYAFTDNSNVNSIIDVRLENYLRNIKSKNNKQLRTNDIKNNIRRIKKEIPYSLKSLSLILNSDIFNVLALCNAGDASGDYYKLNKQFIGSIPVPILTRHECITFSKMYDQISNTVSSYVTELSDSNKEYYYTLLKHLNNSLNDIINHIYGVSFSDVSKLKKHLPYYHSWLQVLTSQNKFR